jgi:hypothetical protein
MTCDKSQCLPPEAVDFSFKISGNKKLANTARIIEKNNSADVSDSLWMLFFIAFLSGLRLC